MPAPRPDPVRFDLGLYPLVTEVLPRFADVDVLGHLNNAALASIYEEGRVAFHRGHGLDVAREDGTRALIAQVLINYIGEGFYPDPLTMGTGVSHVGRSSYTVSQGLFQRGRCIGTADTVIVYGDAKGSRPLTAEIRAILEGHRLRGGVLAQSSEAP